jgi:hypothetical protein
VQTNRSAVGRAVAGAAMSDLACAVLGIATVVATRGTARAPGKWRAAVRTNARCAGEHRYHRHAGRRRGA